MFALGQNVGKSVPESHSQGLKTALKYNLWAIKRNPAELKDRRAREEKKIQLWDSKNLDSGSTTDRYHITPRSLEKQYLMLKKHCEKFINSIKP